jgi:hypothetical protein
MNDMRSAIIPKSDQMNADDLIGGSRTITITKVEIKPGEQPISIFYGGDGGKPYKCCKSMARVMVSCWGADANAYTGRSMTLYRDPGVKWGGMAVGGIRISHMSHIDNAQTMALTETKGNKKPFTVKPLAVEKKIAPPKRPAPQSLLENSGTRAPDPSLATWMQWLDADLAACQTADQVAEIAAFTDVANALQKAPETVQAKVKEKLAAAHGRVTEAVG